MTWPWSHISASETSYIIALTPDGENRYRHCHVLEKKRITEFRLRYEAYLDGELHVVVRYDTAHGFTHRDMIHPDGTEAETIFRQWDYEQGLTFGKRELKQNWAVYRQSYVRELARMKRKKRGKP